MSLNMISSNSRLSVNDVLLFYIFFITCNALIKYDKGNILDHIYTVYEHAFKARPAFDKSDHA